MPPWQEKSKAIPFLPAAPALDGTMAGDKGFDPLLLSNIVPLKWAREVRSVAVALLPPACPGEPRLWPHALRFCVQAELKHARICMLGVAGYVSVDLGFRVPYAPEVSCRHSWCSSGCSWTLPAADRAASVQPCSSRGSGCCR